MGMHDAPALDMLLLVHILFLISLASLFVLIGAAAAIVHHIRMARHKHRVAEAPPEPSFAEHLESAARYGTPRSPRIVPAQSAQTISSRKECPSRTVPQTGSSADTQPRERRPGPQLIPRTSGTTRRQQLSETDTIQTPSAPRLRVVAGNHFASTTHN